MPMMGLLRLDNMALLKVTQLGGVNTYLNPLLSEGQLIHATNVLASPLGAKTKRPGYITYLGTPDNSQVTSLFDWHLNDGTTFYNYRASGSSLYYSTQGTGAWTLCGNGTISPGSYVGHAVLDNTLIIGDGVGSTRHTTNGTSFTDTTLAPVASQFEQYQNRIYAIGTSSTEFYSTTNDLTNWNLSGTSDSSSLTIPGAGKLSSLFKVSDMLCSTKNSGLAYRWDGFNLVDTCTTLGPSSPYSVKDIEGYKMLINRLGHYGYGGGKFQLLSNAVQRQFYNDQGTGMAGNDFNTAPATVFKYGYHVGMGTSITDDFTQLTMNNVVLRYDYQKNEYTNYCLYNNPTAMHTFKDVNQNEVMIFGDSSGQCYQFSGTAKSDNGQPIVSDMMYVTSFSDPQWDKKFNWFYAFFNPGCNAQVQCAISETYTNSRLKWFDVGDVVDGVVKYRFPDGSRGKLLYIKFRETSVDYPFTCYGFAVDADPIKK